LSGSGSLYDTSVWMALAFAAHPMHRPAQEEFLRASPADRALFCRATQQSFLRLLSSPKVTGAYGVTLTNRQALAVYDGFAASPNVGFVEEPKGVFARWRRLADLATSSPKRWMDAYLAAFAMEAGLKLVTGDGDFNSFPGLTPMLLTAPSAAEDSVPSPPPTGSGPISQ
jgi:toxin-antitoxin system PIN domain toxin